MTKPNGPIRKRPTHRRLPNNRLPTDMAVVLADKGVKSLTAKQQAQAAGGVKVTTNGKGNKAAAAPTAKKPKLTDPALVKVVTDHATKNKDRNGWGVVLTWEKGKLEELLAGAKTENAAIKRTRASIDAA